MEGDVSGKLMRQIAAKRLRPGREPEDVTIEVVEEPEAGAGPALVGDVGQVAYLVHTAERTVQLVRIETMENKYGSESVFEDQAGNCYVCNRAFRSDAASSSSVRIA